MPNEYKGNYKGKIVRSRKIDRKKYEGSYKRTEDGKIVIINAARYYEIPPITLLHRKHQEF